MGVILCSMLVSCAEEERSRKVIKCDVKLSHSISDTNLIDSVEFISLQDSLVVISDVNKVLCKDDIVYILDDGTKSLYLFEKNGGLIKKHSALGRASNEYLNLDDFFIDNFHNTVNLISQHENKMLIYNCDLSNLVEVKKMPRKFVRMECMENGYIGYMGNYKEGVPHNLWVVTENMEVKSHSSEIYPAKEFEYSRNVLPFSTYRGKVYFHGDTGLDILCAEHIDSIPKIVYTLDCGEHNPPVYTREDLDDFSKSFELYNNHVMNIYQFQETDNNLLFLFLYGGQFRLLVYDKSSGESNVVRLDCYTKEYLFPFGKVVGMTENCIYTIVDADDIYAVWKGGTTKINFEKTHPEYVRNLRKKFQTVDPVGNPFLVIYHLTQLSAS